MVTHGEFILIPSHIVTFFKIGIISWATARFLRCFLYYHHYGFNKIACSAYRS